MYEEAKQFVIQTQKASTSLIERKFSIGYQRAARLIDIMEENGIVGPALWYRIVELSKGR